MEYSKIQLITVFSIFTTVCECDNVRVEKKGETVYLQGLGFPFFMQKYMERRMKSMKDLKEVLGDSFWMKQQLKSKLIQIDRFVELAKNLDRVTQLPDEEKNWVDEKLDKVQGEIELTINLILEDILLLLEEQEKLSFWILDLENLPLQMVMEKRYLCSEDWDTIAEDMGYSKKKVKKLHEKALSKMKKQNYGFDLEARILKECGLSFYQKSDGKGES